MKKYFLIILTLFLLPSCSREPSHVPSILSLPAVLITNSIENSVYNARRNKVKKYVMAHYDELNIEIQKGAGGHLDGLLVQAGVKDKAIAQQQLQRDYLVMFKNIQLMTESMMNKYASLYVHQSQRKLKTINGFSYSEASNIIATYIGNDFDTFRLSVKEKKSGDIEALADELNIQDNENRRIFIEFILEQYDRYFIEPVVVGVMMVK